MDGLTEVAGDLAAAMADAALALNEPETVEEALARLVLVAQSIIPARSSAASRSPIARP